MALLFAFDLGVVWYIHQMFMLQENMQYAVSINFGNSDDAESKELSTRALADCSIPFPSRDNLRSNKGL